jgi:hypothetical protein
VAQIGPHHRFPPLLSSLLKEEHTHLHLLALGMSALPRYLHGVLQSQ